jgi:hypothetical protein
MHTLSFGLLMASLLSSVFATTLSPSSVIDGKLHGILPVVNQKVTYSEVVDCGSVSQADLFRRARLWIAQSSSSSASTFSLNDKETGDLVSRGKQVVSMPRSESFAGGVFSFRYSFVIECSNRKYRATITQIDVEDGNSDKLIPIEVYSQRNEKDLQLIYQELDKQLKGTLQLLQENVKNYKGF